MKYTCILCFLCAVVSTIPLQAQQSSNLVDIEYVSSPSDENFDFQSLKAEFNVPIPLKKGFLGNTLGFEYSSLDYTKAYAFDTGALTDFYKISYALSYIRPLEKDWRFIARINPSVNSNFTGNLSTDDVVVEGGLLAAKTWRSEGSPKRSTLTFGIIYATLSGKPGVLPYISYKKIVNKNIAYSVGFPSTYFQYTFNPQHRVRIGAKAQGFYSNLSGPGSPVIDNTRAEKAQFSNLLANIEYTYTLKETWKIKANLGYSFRNNYILLDQDREELFDFDVEPRTFISVGVSYDLIAALNKKKKVRSK